MFEIARRYMNTATQVWVSLKDERAFKAFVVGESESAFDIVFFEYEVPEMLSDLKREDFIDFSTIAGILSRNRGYEMSASIRHGKFPKEQISEISVSEPDCKFKATGLLYNQYEYLAESLPYSKVPSWDSQEAKDLQAKTFNVFNLEDYYVSSEDDGDSFYIEENEDDSYSEEDESE